MIPSMVECDFCQQRKHHDEAKGWIVIAGSSLQLGVLSGLPVTEHKNIWANSPMHFCSIECLETYFRGFRDRYKQ